MIEFIIFVLVGIVFAVSLHSLKSTAARKTSTYRMYAARDDLVCLVAEGKLSEESPVFQYYYNRANFLLKKAPHIGIDHAIETILFSNGTDVETALAEAQKKADEMYGLVKNETEEVSAAVTSYYEASRDMILAHSSKIRLMYVFLIKARGWELIGHVAAKKTVATLKAAQFADREANQFRHLAHQ